MSRWFLVVNSISSISPHSTSTNGPGLDANWLIRLNRCVREAAQHEWSPMFVRRICYFGRNEFYCFSLNWIFRIQILRFVMMIMVWNRRWNRMCTNWPWNNFNVMMRIMMNWIVWHVMDWKNWMMWFVVDWMDWMNWMVDQWLMMMSCGPWGGPPRVQRLPSIWVPTGQWTPWFIYYPRSWLGCFLLIFVLFLFGKCAQRQRTEADNLQQLKWRIRRVMNNLLFTNSMQRYKQWTCFLIYCWILLENNNWNDTLSDCVAGFYTQNGRCEEGLAQQGPTVG